MNLNTLSLPEPSTSRITGLQKFFVDCKYLLLEQLLEMAHTWYWHVSFALVLPIAFVFGFGRIGGGNNASPEGLLYVISGAAVFAVANDGLYVLASRIGLMRRDGQLLYYTSLPINRSALFIALIASRLLITLPGMLIPLVFGAWLYDLPLTFSLWLVILFPVAALALSAMGMLLGSVIESLDILYMLTNLILFILVMGAPVFIPMEMLPLPLQIVGYALPPTYVANALRAILTNNIDTVFYANLAVLFGMAIFGFLAVQRWLRWRVD